VVLDPDAVRSDVRAALAARLGLRHKVRVVSIPELVDWFAEQARRAFASLHVLGFLVLIVVLVGVGDALAAGIVERTRDLGVVRALGARRRVVGRIVVGEALMLAVLGIILAGALGLGLGVMWVKATFPALIGWTLSLHLPLAQGAMLVAGACSVCLLASYLPARRAARLNPILAIRTE
jgi:putative ABC transport system permease protein